MALEQYEVRNRLTGEVQFTAQIETTPEMLPSVKLGLAVRWARGNGANLSGANLSCADLSGANLSCANLSGANLSCANLYDANLYDADLRDADLRDADLRGANLRGADLSWANLYDADLSGANLYDADLYDANLSCANLSGANLSCANLYDANLYDADLRDADLRDASGLTDEQLRPIIADYRYILSQAHGEVAALIGALRAGRVDGSTYDGECACLVGSLENSGASGLPHDPSSPAERWFSAIRKGDKPGDASAGGFAAGKALEWAEQYCRDTGIALPEGAPA